jgi:hypothetical protein
LSAAKRTKLPVDASAPKDGLPMTALRRGCVETLLIVVSTRVFDVCAHFSPASSLRVF